MSCLARWIAGWLKHVGQLIGMKVLGLDDGQMKFCHWPQGLHLAAFFKVPGT